MERSTRLDLPLLLPEVEEEQDECIARLVRLLERRDGVLRVHVVRAGETIPEPVDRDGQRDGPVVSTTPQLCLHYDPDRLTLAQITELAKLAGAGVSDRYAHATVRFRSVGSEDEGRRIEDALRAARGVTAASVNFPGQVARIEYDRRLIDRAAIDTVLRGLDAIPAPIVPKPAAGAAVDRAQAAPAREAEAIPRKARLDVVSGWYTRNRELVWSLVSGALLGAAWLIDRATDGSPLVLALYISAYVFGARDNVGHFLRDLRRGRFHFNIDLLMVLAAAGAAILGEWFEGALLLFLFSLGHALEHYALGRARNAISALAELAPATATLLRDGREALVPIEQVRPGDSVVVKPAERIAVDGEVTSGRSAVNQAPITGESVPVDKVPGERVFAGSVNGEGALVITVSAAVGDRTLDRVIRLVAEAETQKAPTQQFTDRFERVFVPLVLVGDALLVLVPPLLGLWSWSESFYRAMAVLVAASPCALALGTPAAVLAGIAQAARKGVLIKGGSHLETLGTVRVLALDKTGTITKGEPAVIDIVPLGEETEASVLSMAAAVERRSQHPLARAVLRAAEERSLRLPQSGELKSVTGRGVRSTVDGRTVEVGRLLMFEENGGNIPPNVRTAVTNLEEAGRTTMVVRSGPVAGGVGNIQWVGVLGIADEARAGVRQTVTDLREAGIERLVMLTGDNAGVGNAVGRAVGIAEVRAGLLPEDKVTAIQELAASGRVAMVGDGVNDAPALAHATVGIAMGGAGTAAALETADVALMGDDLGRLPFVIGLSRQARRIIRQNLYVSLAVIVGLVVTTASGIAGIGPAVVVHEGSTLVVIANALRLLAYDGT